MSVIDLGYRREDRILEQSICACEVVNLMVPRRAASRKSGQGHHDWVSRAKTTMAIFVFSFA